MENLYEKVQKNEDNGMKDKPAKKRLGLKLLLAGAIGAGAIGSLLAYVKNSDAPFGFEKPANFSQSDVECINNIRDYINGPEYIKKHYPEKYEKMYPYRAAEAAKKAEEDEELKIKLKGRKFVKENYPEKYEQWFPYHAAREREIDNTEDKKLNEN